MNRRFLAAFFAAGALAAAPALAQQSQPKETVPIQLPAKQVIQLQQKLHQEGLYTGPVDGKWGPETQAAVRNFQTKENLPVTGQLDPQTMSKLGINVSSGSSSSTSGSGSSQMSKQLAEQMLQQQGYSQVQLNEQNGQLKGTATKGGKQYQISVSQNGQITEMPQQ